MSKRSVALIARHWARVCETLAARGFTHPRSQRAWRLEPSTVEGVAERLQLALRLAEAPLAAGFRETQRLHPDRLWFFEHLLRDLIQEVDDMERGWGVDEPARRRLLVCAGQVLEPFVVKLLAAVSPESLLAKTLKKEAKGEREGEAHLDLHSWLNRLTDAGLMPLEADERPPRDKRELGGWLALPASGERSSLGNALRDVYARRLGTAHLSPGAPLEDVLVEARGAIALVLALADLARPRLEEALAAQGPTHAEGASLLGGPVWHALHVHPFLDPELLSIPVQRSQFVGRWSRRLDALLSAYGVTSDPDPGEQIVELVRRRSAQARPIERLSLGPHAGVELVHDAALVHVFGQAVGGFPLIVRSLAEAREATLVTGALGVVVALACEGDTPRIEDVAERLRCEVGHCEVPPEASAMVGQETVFWELACAPAGVTATGLRLFVLSPGDPERTRRLAFGVLPRLGLQLQKVEAYLPLLRCYERALPDVPPDEAQALFAEAQAVARNVQAAAVATVEVAEREALSGPWRAELERWAVETRARALLHDPVAKRGHPQGES